MSRPVPGPGARPPRGSGRSRRDRRTLRRGGDGVAGVLNRTVGDWAGARIRPMFGRWGYFAGDHLFGCYPLRAKDHDLWIRLAARDQARALASPGIRPHRRFASRGWVECDVTEPREVPRAIRWLRCAYEQARREGQAEGERPLPAS